MCVVSGGEFSRRDARTINSRCITVPISRNDLHHRHAGVTCANVAPQSDPFGPAVLDRPCRTANQKRPRRLRGRFWFIGCGSWIWTLANKISGRTRTTYGLLTPPLSARPRFFTVNKKIGVGIETIHKVGRRKAVVDWLRSSDPSRI